MQNLLTTKYSNHSKFNNSLHNKGIKSSLDSNLRIQTIRRRFVEGELYSRGPARKPSPYPSNKQRKEYVLQRSTYHDLHNSGKPYYLVTNRSLICVGLMEFVMYGVPQEKD
ncbi:hypothetical protein Trydic_g20339 [Trypoxylus dichotomus]